MDMLEYAAQQIKKGKKPSEIRQLLVQNGYPVYEVENALSVAESKDERKGKMPFKISVNAPGYVIILAVSGILMIIGIIAIILYFI